MATPILPNFRVTGHGWMLKAAMDLQSGFADAGRRLTNLDHTKLAATLEEALEEYSKLYAHYVTLTKCAHTLLDKKLKEWNQKGRPGQARCLQARVSSRTKEIDSLRDNVKVNAASRGYKDWDDVRDAHHDLAAVLLTLYMPGEKSRQKAHELINSVWPHSEPLRKYGDKSGGDKQPRLQAGPLEATRPCTIRSRSATRSPRRTCINPAEETNLRSRLCLPYRMAGQKPSMMCSTKPRRMANPPKLNAGF